jgi:hypothetical protein
MIAAQGDDVPKILQLPSAVEKTALALFGGLDRRAVRAVLLLCTMWGAFLAAQGTAPFNDSIRLADLRADVGFLAGDSFRGRFIGTTENLLAAEFVRSRFERAGLAGGAPDKTFLQPVRLMGSSLGEGNTLQASLPGSGAFTYTITQDFYPRRFSPSRTAGGPLVYAGFGMVEPRLGRDDFGDRVKGRVVLVLDHEPGEKDRESPFEGLVSAEAAEPLRKALAAQAKGAVGILFVSDVHNHPLQDFATRAREYWPQPAPRIDQFTLASWASRLEIPAAQISPALASSLLSGTGRALAELARDAEQPRGVEPTAIEGVEVTLTTAVTRRTIVDRNVLGLVEGADPQLKNEVVIVSAHYDHEGADGTLIYNGADDNASGVAGLLEIAEAYGLALASNQRPRRSVLLAAWGSEERGPLLGSWAYVDEPTFPMARTVAVLNMDMIGRNEEVLVGGGPKFEGLDPQTAHSNRNSLNLVGFSRHPELAAIIERVNGGGFGLDLRLRYDNNPSNLIRRSDQWPFLQQGVPALWFLTGLHPDYHTRFDRPERLNYEKMQTIARLVHQASWELATQADRPK